MEESKNTFESGSVYPHFSNKHLYQSLITPTKHIEYYKTTGRYPSYSPPKTVIFCYSDRLFKYILQSFAHQQCDGGFSKVYFLTDYPGVAIANFGVGAPINAMKLDLLIAWGIKQVISIGTAGGIQKDLQIGDIIVCEQAIRDEGTSHHYLPYSKYAHPSKKMQKKLFLMLEAAKLPYKRGTSWTTDSFFRQTWEEVEHYQKEGVLCVEMEASALFSVASIYNMEIAALLTISDTHSGQEWTPYFREDKMWERLCTLFKIALASAANSPEKVLKILL